jgi:hypothetical protein
MKALLIKTDDTFEALEDISLHTLQEAVGGYIEMVYLQGTNLYAYVNEEGKMLDLPPNIFGTCIAASLGALQVGDFIRGNFVLITSLEEEIDDEDQYEGIS